jgi:hypothetical protein
MQEIFQTFYKRCGVIRVQQLIAPRVFDETLFQFPKNSILHFVSHDENQTTPDPLANYFKRVSSQVLIDHVMEMSSAKGTPRKLSITGPTLFRAYHFKNRGFKYIKDPQNVVKNPAFLEVFNYGYLQKTYTYPELPLTPYYKWYNIEKTVWNNILRVAKESDRQNFVFAKVPDILPSVSSLEMYSDKVNTQLSHVFDSPDKLFILEVWKWLDNKTRSLSIIGEMSETELSKVDIIFQYRSKWCVVNLGYMNNWRKETLLPKELKQTQLPTDLLQKCFLKLLISLQATVPDDVADIEEEPTDNVRPAEGDEDTVKEFDDGDDDGETAAPSYVNAAKDSAALTKATTVTENKPQEEAGDTFDTIMADLDKDLAAVDFIEKQSFMQKGINANGIKDSADVPTVVSKLAAEVSEEELLKIRETVYADKPTNEVLKSQINQYADYGLMAASEYRNMIKQAENIKNIPDPYGSNVSVEEFAVLKPEDLLFDAEKIKMADNANVFDKSMMESTLNVFDSEYVKKALPKDVVGMVTNIQRAGIIIQNYEVEQCVSVLGDYEAHTLQIKPIDGVSSVIRFKLPKVDEEGNYVSGGNKYRMRKQRGD